jgi:hypothetical protein
MPLEFALRPRFDLNRPPKRRRFSGVELHPLALPIAAYWLAIGGGTYALVQSRVAEASNEAQVEITPDSAPITEAVPSDLPPIATATTAPSLDSAVAEISDDVEPEPAPVATHRDEPPPPPPAVVAAAPREVTAPRREAPPPVENDEPVRSAPAPLEPRREPEFFRDEAPSRAPEPIPPRREPPPTSLPSCEAAADSANQIIDMGAGRGAPDLTRDAFAAVLENGSYLSACAIPARTALEVCAAVQGGKVVGVTVSSEPRDPAINACVRRAVAALRFPQNPRLDVTRTRFEPAR